MRYPIDVLFCSKDWVVRRVITLEPTRLSRLVPFAAFAVELPAGAAEGVVRGDRLILERD